MIHRNYFPDQNRFKLAGPPIWWLNQLWTFDASLVVVPSRQSFVYRLAQRRKPQLHTTMVNDLTFKESDTRMLASYGLIPVTSILATANWSNPTLFEQLRQRAPWRMGGAEKVNSMLEAQDQQDDLDKRVKTDDHLTHLGKDAWKMYNKKIGLRSNLYSPVVKKPTKPTLS